MTSMTDFDAQKEGLHTLTVLVNELRLVLGLVG